MVVGSGIAERQRSHNQTITQSVNQTMIFLPFSRVEHVDHVDVLELARCASALGNNRYCLIV